MLLTEDATDWTHSSSNSTKFRPRKFHFWTYQNKKLVTASESAEVETKHKIHNYGNSWNWQPEDMGANTLFQKNLTDSKRMKQCPLTMIAKEDLYIQKQNDFQILGINRDWPSSTSVLLQSISEPSNWSWWRKKCWTRYEHMELPYSE